MASSTSTSTFEAMDLSNPVAKSENAHIQTKGCIVTTASTVPRRPLATLTNGKPLTNHTGIGFIPVQRSFTIWGDPESNTSSMEFSDDPMELDVTNDENKDIGAGTTAQELSRVKSCRKNLFQGGAEKAVGVEPRGVLTERKHAVYDHPEYVEDIYKYWINYERRTPIKPRYMSKQEDITHNMRSILIDWLVEVGQEYDFQEGTIFVAVGFLDRFLGKMSVARSKLQLVGTTAVYIAAKLQEVNPPTIADVVSITDETYSKDQVLIMEGIMLRTIQFDLMAPTIADFVQGLATLLALDSHLVSLALYLAELSMMDGERFLRYKPSAIATAAIAVARYTHNNNFWDSKISLYSQLTYAEIRPVSGDLLNAYYAAPMADLSAVYEKYKSVRYNCVSYSILPPALPLL